MGKIRGYVGGIIENASWDGIKALWELIPAGWKSLMIPGILAAISRFWESVVGFQPTDAWVYSGFYFGISLFIVNELRRAGPFLAHEPGYNSIWNARNDFALYQAACLWEGKEPDPNFPINSPINAVFDLLQLTIQQRSDEFRHGEDGECDLVMEFKASDKNMRNFPISRYMLEKFAVEWNVRPQFLFGRDISKIKRRKEKGFYTRRRPTKFTQ